MRCIQLEASIQFLIHSLHVSQVGFRRVTRRITTKTSQNDSLQLHTIDAYALTDNQYCQKDTTYNMNTML